MKRIPLLIKQFVQWFGNESKSWKPPGFYGLSIFEVTKDISKHFKFSDLTEKAAAISYNFIMSIPPACLFIFTLIPGLPFISRDMLRQQLHSIIYKVIPSEVYNHSLITFVDRFIDGSKFGVISFTFILSLFFASNGVMGLIRSFNTGEYIGFKKNKGLAQRWEAIRLTIILFSLLLITLILLFLQDNILDWIGIRDLLIRKIILTGRWVLAVGLIFFSFAFIYRYVPATIQRWKLFSPGAVIATCLSIIVTLGFIFFVENFGRYNVLYGSIGTVMVVMVMVFLNSMVTFLGFMINLSIHILRNGKENEDLVAENPISAGDY